MDGIAPADENRLPIAYLSPHQRDRRAAARLTLSDERLAEDGMGGEADQDSDGQMDILLRSQQDNLHAPPLRVASGARGIGLEDGPLFVDPLWEQWLKDAIERNELGVNSSVEAIRQGRPFPISPTHILDATVNPPTLSLATTAPGTHFNASPTASAMNDTQIAMVNMWNLGNGIVRNVNAGNAALVAPAAVTVAPAAATTASAQPAGEAR